MMRGKMILSALVAGALSFGVLAAQTLPKVTIMGKSFYYYESVKGETLGEIAERFGWDLGTLERTNTGTGSHPDAGTLLYYPVAKADKKEKSESADANATSNNSADVNRVISDNIPRSASQDAPSAEVKSNSAASSAPSSADGYVYHQIEEGESLYGIARRYSTTIENLFRLNPGLSASAPKTGSRIRVQSADIVPETVKETVEVTKVDSIADYKVRRGDSWESIAESHNIPVETLRGANPSTDRLTKGDYIAIPVLSTTSMEREVVAEDPRAGNSEGVMEIYQEVHSLAPIAGSEKAEYPSVGIAVVLTDIGTTADEKRTKKNKEMEFSRGILAAVDALKDYPYQTRLTIIDGSLPSDSVTTLLRDFRPTLMISTSDTEMPEYLVKYASSNSTMLVNAFGLKEGSYEDNPYILQFMTPSAYMNSEVADYFSTVYKDYHLMVAGSPDPSDQMGNSIISSFAALGNDRVEEISIDDIENLEIPDERGKYIFYVTPTGQNDVKNVLNKISLLSDSNYLADIRVIGRPNWVPFVTSIRELLGQTKASIPSRFYFDPDNTATRNFINDYDGLFKLRPMKASPVYCATAYDIITYLVPNLAANGGDFNAPFTSYPTLQSPIALERVSNWGGIANRGVYILGFSPYGSLQRIMIPSDMDKETY